MSATDRKEYQRQYYLKKKAAAESQPILKSFNKHNIFLICLVVVLTAVLSIEQIEFYLEKFSLIRSIFYALALDLSLITLGYFSTKLKGTEYQKWNKLIYPALVFCSISVALITSSNARKVFQPDDSKVKTLIEKEIKDFEERKNRELKTISELPSTYVTAREKAQERLDAVELKLDSSKSELRKLVGDDSTSFQEASMIYLRWLLVGLNVLFSALAGAVRL